MKLLPSLIVCFAPSIVAAPIPKADEIAIENLAGKWVVADTKPGAVETSMQFTKNKKVTLVGDLAGAPITLRGTYVLKNDQLKLSIEFGDNANEQKFRIAKLTKTELKLIDARNVAQSFRREVSTKK